MKCSEIIDLLNKLAPEAMACDWDNPGLLAGRSDKEVHRLFIALDATDEVIKQACEAGADMLLTHHPLIFKPVKKINDGDFIGRRLMTLIRQDISYYAMHTNFDAAPGCMAALAANRLSLLEQQVLEPMGMVMKDGRELPYGIGACGTLEIPLTVEELGMRIKEAFGIPFVTVYAGRSGCRIKKVAVCPGAGGSTVQAALSFGADAYITGDVSHHEGIDAVANNMAVFDAGHYGIEHIFIDFMEEYLKDKLGDSISIEKAAAAFPSCVL